jgi:hypothetical protein
MVKTTSYFINLNNYDKENTMITILATLGTFLMVFAVGSIEADNYMIGFILALLGVSSFVMTIMLQEKNEPIKLYYKQ